jgi:hypothetical protein
MTHATIHQLSNASMARDGKEAKVLLVVPHWTGPSVSLSVQTKEVVRKKYGKVQESVYRLDGDRISHLAAELLLAAYPVRQTPPGYMELAGAGIERPVISFVALTEPDTRR